MEGKHNNGLLHSLSVALIAVTALASSGHASVWNDGQPMLTGRSEFAAAAGGDGRLYCFGGRFGDRLVDEHRRGI